MANLRTGASDNGTIRLEACVETRRGAIMDALVAWVRDHGNGVVDIIDKIILGVIGLWLAHSLSRHVKQRIAERRIKSYESLWQIMETAMPARIRGVSLPGSLPSGYLTQAEREELYARFTQWYYEKGNGMVVGYNTRRLYLAVKDNLICDPAKFQPAELLKGLKSADLEEKRGELSIRQLSLLRARMRADLKVYGSLYFEELKDEDKKFLKACGERLYRSPWNRLVLREWLPR